MALAAALRRFIDWFWDASLPLWAEHGADAAGGFHECLDHSGRPIEGVPRRVRVQARQIHVFATAARLGRAPRSRDLAARGFACFLRQACPEGGARGCVHLLAADGAVMDDRRDLYDQAFLLLAAASMIRAFDDERARMLAVSTLDFMDRELKSPYGGYIEDDRGGRPRRQNPHMHLFEAFSALAAATGSPLYAGRASEIEALLRTVFFDSRIGALREFFTTDLKPLASAKGAVIEPGHMAEWTWLLRASGGDLQRMLYRRAAELGAREGFLVNAVEVGTPPGGARRLWPQTEYLKASLVMARRGEEGAAQTAERLIGALFASYLHHPVNGLWCDEYDGEGRPIATVVPASILYHLMEAAIEAETHLKELGA